MNSLGVLEIFHISLALFNYFTSFISSFPASHHSFSSQHCSYILSSNTSYTVPGIRLFILKLSQLSSLSLKPSFLIPSQHDSLSPLWALEAISSLSHDYSTSTTHLTAMVTYPTLFHHNTTSPTNIFTLHFIYLIIHSSNWNQHPTSSLANWNYHITHLTFHPIRSPSRLWYHT